MADAIRDTQGGTSPHLVDGTASPLDALVMRALARFGEMAPSSMEGDVVMGFLDYANEVIDDILGHPYFPRGASIPYYVSINDVRPIPDHIVVAGLLARHAEQQRSQMAKRYFERYYDKLNQIMLRARFGTGAEFDLLAVDYPNHRERSE